MQGKSLASAILLGGLIAGTIDIGAAALINHVGPIVIAQAIASGLLGRASFSGGWQTAALGVSLQWFMSLVIAAIFAIAAKFSAPIRRHWMTAGLAYGVVIFAVMNYAIVPLSNAYPKHTHPMPPDKVVENMLAMLLFGLIVSYFAHDIVRQKASLAST